jgi:lysylphosphatidylglycerol synthase-like protein
VTARRDMLLAATSLVLLVFVGSRIGLQTVMRELAAVGAGIAIIIILSLARLLLQTRSWSIALRRVGAASPMGELMLIRLASQAIGYLTVLGPAASEPMKISLLRQRAKSPTAATIVDTGVYWFTSALVGIAGCLAAIVIETHAPKSLAPALILVSMFVAGVFALARPKLRLAPLADRLGERCPRWLRKAGQVEIAIREFAAQDRRAIRQMFLLDLACQVLMASEVVTVFLFLRLPLHAGVILGLEAATRMVKMAAGWMPARIGADESGAAGAFLSFGLPAAAGVALALARRTRDLLACLVGLTWLAWVSRRNRKSAVRGPEVSIAPAEGI